jgi:hypothetical protein
LAGGRENLTNPVNNDFRNIFRSDKEMVAATSLLITPSSVPFPPATLRNGTSSSWQIRRLKSPPGPGWINAAPMPTGANPYAHPRKGNFQFIHILEP